MIAVSTSDPLDLSPTDADTSAELEGIVRAERRQLKQSLDDLGNTVRHKVDVRSHLQERPWIGIGLALAAGVVVGVLSNHRARDPFRP